jgi:uncharacterized protein YecT (DUF1311 family)
MNLTIGVDSFRITMTVPFLLVLGLVSSCSAQTSEEIDQAWSHYEKIDKELNRLYERILEDYSDDSVFVNRLKESERVWLKYRDAEFLAVYPHADSAEDYYGSVFRYCKPSLLAELEQDRIYALSRWSKGARPDDACPGSVKSHSALIEAASRRQRQR